LIEEVKVWEEATEKEKERARNLEIGPCLDWETENLHLGVPCEGCLIDQHQKNAEEKM